MRRPDSKFSIVPDREGTEIPWLTEDPDNLSSFAGPHVTVIYARVYAGEVLYLPAMYFHSRGVEPSQ